MRIGIDGNEANLENRVGVNQYAAELLNALEKLKEAKEHEWVIYLSSPPLPHLPKERTGWTYKKVSGGLIQKTLTVWQTRPDVYFAPTHYLPLFPLVPTVMSVMDLGYLRFPDQFKKRDFFQLKYWTLISLLEAHKILAISESTKSDIMKHYPWAKRKIAVTPLGYNKSQFKYPISRKGIERVTKKYGIEGEYVLYLGTLKPNKNIEGVVEAFSHITNLKLVIAGKKGWLFGTIFKKVEELGLQDRVIFTDFFSEEDKAPLMAGAKVFVSPSFWEGFGIPALESMAVGTPVVVSNVASYPEVVGEAGVLVDPYNVDSIAQGISKVVSAPSVAYNKLVSAGLKQAEKFSWENTARRTLEVLKNI